MSSTLLLVIVAASAYLAAHVVFGWLGRKYLVVSGAEYLLLGIVARAQSRLKIGFRDRDDVNEMRERGHGSSTASAADGTC